LIICKWRETLGQPAFADKFASSWEGKNFTRIEMNSSAVVPGGIAADNNCLEAKNGSHKGYTGRHNTRGLSQSQLYIGQMADWIEHCSITDTEFGTFLNPDVHCNYHYTAVWKMLCAHISPLTIVFPESTGGIVIIASQFLLNELAAQEVQIEETVVEYKKAARGWLKEYKAMVNSHKGIEGLTFDELCGVDKRKGTAGWARSFYFLTPIVDVLYLQNLYSRLHDSGLLLMEFEDLQKLGIKGLMSCSCSKFLHRAWCIHSCVDAFKKKIIVGYPTQMDPSNQKPKRGRPTGRLPLGLERHELCGETN